MEPPSARPWLGVGAALSALPAAGGCFCAALVLAVVADSDPGAVYEQHRWLGAIVAAGAVCAFVAMMGWATLRHGGLPAPVLLMALALAGVPFLLPGGLFLPAAALAVAGCAALATRRPRPPAAPPRRARAFLTAALAGAALVLAVGQAIAVGFAGPGRRARRSSRATPKADAARVQPKPAERSRARPGDAEPARQRRKVAPAAGRAAAPDAPAPAELRTGRFRSGRRRSGRVRLRADSAPADAAPADARAPRRARLRPRLLRRARRRGEFRVAWQMLAPEVQRAFGGFAAWRKGYARTVSHSPAAVTRDRRRAPARPSGSRSGRAIAAPAARSSSAASP